MRKALYWAISILVLLSLFWVATVVLWLSVRMWKDIFHG